jgi:hypothetical protein
MKWPMLTICVVLVSIFAVLPDLSYGQIPEPNDVPSGLPVREHFALLQLRSDLLSRRDALEKEIKAQQSFCSHVNAKDTMQVVSCGQWREKLKGLYTDYMKDLKQFKVAVNEKTNEAVTEGSFYAKQTDKFEPMKGGHPIDAPGSPSVGLHGLVGGTTWTYGFLWPHKHCDAQCVGLITRKLEEQLILHCKSQDDPESCKKEGLPFTPESYDMVLSMGSYHTAIEDLATRVVWDGMTFGEFSRHHKEIFSSLSGRKFDTLDCHSNGAMLCLAALRNEDPNTKTTAKKVRLFGPQINAEAAALWHNWMVKNPGSAVEIYINNGDPVPAASWTLTVPRTTIGKIATTTWMATPIGIPGKLIDVLDNVRLDRESAVMDKNLDGYGFKLTRFRISDEDSPGSKCDTSVRININCHSMLLYEKKIDVSRSRD